MMLNFKDIAKIFEEIELRLISSLKRNLTRHKQEEHQYGLDWTSWQAEKLRNINSFRRECSAIVNEYQNIIDKNTRKIMNEEFAQGMNGVEIPVADEPHFFGVDDTKINKLIDDVVNLEKHAETAALRTMDDVYRQTVNKAQLAMSTGSVTLQKAIDMAVQDFLNKGINCIVYRNGRHVNIADYVRMALRTTATRANLYGMSAKIRQLGYDTVLVSSYGMCSETCLPWQGRPYIDDVFSMWEGEIQERSNSELWGKSHYCGKWFPLLSTALHGGLFHPNCRHTILMWRDGDPIPKPQDNSKIQRRYKLEQHQRQLENKVRKAKRFAEGQSDPDNLKKAKKLLREAQKELREFIADNNLHEGETILKHDYGKEKIYKILKRP
ncbi:MAG: phage minor capsid protein [Ruminococcus sp.]|nr:phage minor capsid protein [Ruminococcus sp.]